MTNPEESEMAVVNWKEAKEKAHQLLQAVLPKSLWQSLKEKGYFEVEGKGDVYKIAPYSNFWLGCLNCFK